ncbi:hypothetical protein O7599_32020 [Streptomyces sp. WMMC500]|uniref:hypothetical protein n=1 Tax=Streptomyces sp. WMMC500 TaxID=3015154 RepID=UPI00248C06A3|nr:hypothetical protein [Streptomyces sp. WMMC500]WBB60115.1 hypothetical protein O7599_32020 [Streptomyces sp. WMMC500]
MTVGSWERAVREQVGLGRLLPLGAAEDGAWIAERAAAGALRRAAAGVREARVTGLRVGPAEDAVAAGGEAGSDGSGSGAQSADGAGNADGAAAGVGPAPVSALPYGELRIAAECDAAADRPMTATAEALREALLRGAEERLGLRVAAADIHVTGLLETPPTAAEPGPPAQGTGTATDPGTSTSTGTGTATGTATGTSTDTRPSTETRTGTDARTGADARTGTDTRTSTGAPAGTGAPAAAAAPQVAGVLDGGVLRDGDHAEVRVVVDSAYRALDVALAVRARTSAATVTVLVTDIR